MIALGKLSIKGREIPYFLDGEYFQAEIGIELGPIRHKTLEGLKAAITRSLTKKPLNIPFIHWEPDCDDGPRFRKGRIISRHTANNNLIVRYAGESQNQQWRAFYGTMMLKPDTDMAKIEDLFDKKTAADERYRDALLAAELNTGSIGKDDEE